MRILRKLALVGLSVAFCCVSAQAQQTINTVAGGGPNQLPPLSSSLGIPVGVSQDSTGNIYIADAHSNTVYMVSIAGTLSVFAGNGAAGYSGDGAAAAQASLNSPAGIFVDSTGNVFIADSGNNVIREVVFATGFIQTVAGNGTAGFVDNVAPTSGELSNPTAVYEDGSGNLFIADSANNVIREVVAGATPMITTVAGNFALGGGYNGDGILATNAKLNNPKGVFLDTSGTVYVADHLNNRIRTFTVGGNIATIAGNGTSGASGDGGPATSAELNGPTAVYVTGTFSGVSPTGQLYIADTGNHAIRDVIASLPTAQQKIQTVAGNGLPGFTGDGGPARVAELFAPRGVYVDSSQDIFIADTGNSFVRVVAALTGDIHLYAGNGTLGFSGDSATATNASLNIPGGVAADGAGNIYVADTANNVIRQVVVGTGLIQTVAGRGGAACNFSGNGGSATNALLCAPSGVFVDGSGDIFIADTSNHVVREVVFSTGNIVTVAGIGTPGFSGDGGFAIQAQLHSPGSVFVDGAGNIFIADTGNHCIREVPATGPNANKIATVAGVGTIPGYSGDTGLATAAHLTFPGSVYLDGFGNIFIADTGNNVIREVTGGVGGNISTIAGDHALVPGYSGDNGPPTAAQLNGPKGVLVDPSGNLFIADTNNHVIREVAFGTNKIQTVAGNNVAAFAGDGGVPTSASLHSPAGMALDRLGGIFIADTANNRIRDASGLVPIATMTLSVQAVTFNNQVITTASGSQPVQLTNSGSAPLNIFSITSTGTNGTSFSQTNNCGTGLAINASCIVNVTFTPQATGALAANLAISDSAPNSPQLVALSGMGVSPVVLNPTGLSFALEINGNSSQPQSITLTNNQTVALNFTSIAIGGLNATSFSQTNTCGASVPAGGNCTVSIVFNPNVTGTNTALVTFTDDAPGTTQTAALFGLGTAATADLAPTSLTYATTLEGTAAATQVVTLTNNGKDVLNISSITFGGTNPTDFAETDTCGASVLAGTNCTITVTYTPQGGGPRTATMNISDSAGNSPQTVTLSGTGLDFQIMASAAGGDTQTVAAGTTATYTITVTAVGGSVATDTVSVKITCGNVPQGASCSFPNTTLNVTPVAAGNFTLTITTTAHSALPPLVEGPVVLVFAVSLMALFAVLIFMRNTDKSARVKAFGRLALATVVIAMCVSASLMIGCKGPAATSVSGGTGSTPSGTYNPTVSGTAGNDTHTLVLTLNVQ
ncbi:MAG: choice-of-anchor D domain-containing protein [Candidatus Acidiferrales bacterium]